MEMEKDDMLQNLKQESVNVGRSNDVWVSQRKKIWIFYHL